MMLSDASIIERSHMISPFDASMVQPASVDLCLDNGFLRYPDNGQVIDPDVDESLQRYEGQFLVLNPSSFVLGSTIEKITLPSTIGARIEGKSSLARLGIAIHSTGGFIDPGFSGTITLEISNVNTRPVLLRPGMKIAQISFYEMDRAVTHPYGSPGLNSKYQFQYGVTPSRYYKK